MVVLRKLFAPIPFTPQLQRTSEVVTRTRSLNQLKMIMVGTVRSGLVLYVVKLEGNEEDKDLVL